AREQSSAPPPTRHHKCGESRATREWRQSVPGKAVGEDGRRGTGDEMSKVVEVESSFSERPGHPRSRILVEWLDATGGNEGSLVPPAGWCAAVLQVRVRRPYRDVRLRCRSSENVFVKAGCGKTARPVVCPEKAGMFSREQTCRGRSQSPVVWIAEERETEPSKPIDKASQGEVTSHRAVTKVNALWPRKCEARGPSPQLEGEGSMTKRILTETTGHLGGVKATAR